MASMTRTLQRFGNSIAVWLYRRTGGRVGGSIPGAAEVLLLTVAGRKTGTPHTTPVSYIDHGDGYLVVGSNGGQSEDPQWFRNLRAAEAATVQIGGGDPEVVRPTELAGEQRDAAWTTLVAAAPRFAKYQTKTERTIPLALLRRGT
jgi:deazaflavin-dependent oxidoreductase (nitroreductase family)